MDVGLDHASRDACLHRLGDYYAAGQLSADELEARIQVALAAETEEELASAMTGVSAVSTADPAPAEVPRARAPVVSVRGLRWAAAAGVLTTGGLLMAVAGPSSVAGEFAAGVAVAALGFLTHWAVTVRSRRRASSEEPRGERSAAADVSDEPVEERPDTLDDEAASPPPGTAGNGPVPRRVRTLGDVVPTQRVGD